MITSVPPGAHLELDNEMYGNCFAQHTRDFGRLNFLRHGLLDDDCWSSALLEQDYFANAVIWLHDCDLVPACLLVF